jgi:hypothetical protein
MAACGDGYGPIRLWGAIGFGVAALGGGSLISLSGSPESRSNFVTAFGFASAMQLLSLPMIWRLDMSALHCKSPPRRGGAGVRTAPPSGSTLLTGIYRCKVCSCHEILRAQRPGSGGCGGRGRRLGWRGRRAGGTSEAAAAAAAIGRHRAADGRQLGQDGVFHRRGLPVWLLRLAHRHVPRPTSSLTPSLTHGAFSQTAQGMRLWVGCLGGVCFGGGPRCGAHAGLLAPRYLNVHLVRLGASGLLMGSARLLTCVAEVPFFRVSGAILRALGVSGSLAVSVGPPSPPPPPPRPLSPPRRHPTPFFLTEACTGDGAGGADRLPPAVPVVRQPAADRASRAVGALRSECHVGDLSASASAPASQPASQPAS